MYEPVILGFLSRLAAFLVGQLAIAVCLLTGAWWMRIDLRKAYDRVEANPMAFAIFVAAHFFAECYFAAAVLG